MPLEEWRAVPGLHVEASSLGRIRTVDRLVEYKATERTQPYFRLVRGRVQRVQLLRGQRYLLHIRTEGCKATWYVAQLVCLAFHGEPPSGKPWALHRNGIATDDRPDNLYWGSRRDNYDDAMFAGAYARELTETEALEIYRRRKAGEGSANLASAFGVTVGTVYHIARGHTWAWLTQREPK
jgi:hypothetical protein